MSISELPLYDRRRLLEECYHNLRSSGHPQCANCPCKNELIKLYSGLEEFFAWKAHDDPTTRVVK